MNISICVEGMSGAGSRRNFNTGIGVKLQNLDSRMAADIGASLCAWGVALEGAGVDNWEGYDEAISENKKVAKSVPKNHPINPGVRRGFWSAHAITQGHPGSSLEPHFYWIVF